MSRINPLFEVQLFRSPFSYDVGGTRRRLSACAKTTTIFLTVILGIATFGILAPVVFYVSAGCFRYSERRQFLYNSGPFAFHKRRDYSVFDSFSLCSPTPFGTPGLPGQTTAVFVQNHHHNHSRATPRPAVVPYFQPAASRPPVSGYSPSSFSIPAGGNRPSMVSNFSNFPPGFSIPAGSRSPVNNAGGARRGVPARNLNT